jgi:hypothetical protein
MTAPRSAWIRSVSASLMLLGLGWIGHMILSSLDKLQGFWPEAWIPLFLASVFVATSTALNGVIFYLFLTSGMKEPSSLAFGRALTLHFSGQLLRYLPGRFWGFVYQASVTHGEVSKTRLARANIDLMVYSIFGSAIVAGIVAGVRLELPEWILYATAILGSVLIGAIFFGRLEYLLPAAGQALPEKLRHFFSEIARTRISTSGFILVTVVFLFSWLVYLAGWQFLGTAFPIYADIDFIALGALYSLASIIGILSAITPAGLGVREASFIFLTSGLAPPEVIAYFAVFGRFWLLLIEILICLLSFLFFSLRRAR